mgnify:CR=1 FL=1
MYYKTGYFIKSAKMLEQAFDLQPNANLVYTAAKEYLKIGNFKKEKI